MDANGLNRDELSCVLSVPFWRKRSCQELFLPTLIAPSRCADCPPLYLTLLLRHCPRHVVQGDFWQWSATRRIQYSSVQRHRLRVDQSAREWEYVDPYESMGARTPGLPDHD